MIKFPKLLTWLLAPFFMMVDEPSGGGADNDEAAAAAARGDEVDGAGSVDGNEKTQAEKDADDEAARIAAEEAEKTAAGEGKGKSIPLDRHKASLEKVRAERDALQAQLDKKEQGNAVAATSAAIKKTEEEVVAKEDEYNKLVADGETAKATALMREIRALERQMADAKADIKASIATANAVERVRYDAAVDRLEAAYPALNPDHEDFDKEQMAEVLELQDAYKLKGLTPTAALQKAVKLIMGAETRKQDDATSVTPRVSDADVAKAERTEQSTKAALAASKRTPPNTAKVGADSDKSGGTLTAEKVMAMSQDKFAKVNEETLAQLRGDVI